MDIGENSLKVYVHVIADFYPDGRLRPRRVIWKDGRGFDIDRVTDCRRAASIRAGGCGIRYTCMISGRPHYLFYDEKFKWFVEAKANM